MAAEPQHRLLSPRLWIVALLLLAAAPLAAQVSFADSIRADSIRADSARQDSVNNRQAITTARYLEANKGKNTWVPPLPYIGAEGPRADGARIVFTRDSMDWAMARTLGDLVATVPGSYLWRTGWVGTSSPANYRGRGSGSVEYFLDGLPYVAVDRKSTRLNSSHVSLSRMPSSA